MRNEYIKWREHKQRAAHSANVVFDRIVETEVLPLHQPAQQQRTTTEEEKIVDKTNAPTKIQKTKVLNRST